MDNMDMVSCTLQATIGKRNISVKLDCYYADEIIYAINLSKKPEKIDFATLVLITLVRNVRLFPNHPFENLLLVQRSQENLSFITHCHVSRRYIRKLSQIDDWPLSVSKCVKLGNIMQVDKLALLNQLTSLRTMALQTQQSYQEDEESNDENDSDDNYRPSLNVDYLVEKTAIARRHVVLFLDVIWKHSEHRDRKNQKKATTWLLQNDWKKMNAVSFYHRDDKMFTDAHHQKQVETHIGEYATTLLLSKPIYRNQILISDDIATPTTSPTNQEHQTSLEDRQCKLGKQDRG
jgi:hypothetical protein